jgi:hypothetical protein
MGITGRNYPLIKNSFTEFLNNDLREEYHQEKIFNVGDMIEHLDGTSGMVVRRGSNYVSYENEGLVKKAWLYDIQMSEEQPEKTTNMLDELEKEMKDLDEYYEIGTDEYAKHTMAMTPGQPIQNFRQHSKTIEENDIDKFANEDETIDKYKKRYGERWKDELEKAVLRMKKEL